MSTTPFPRPRRSTMTDLIFLALTVLFFAVAALVVKAVERL